MLFEFGFHIDKTWIEGVYWAAAYLKIFCQYRSIRIFKPIFISQRDFFILGNQR